jgi:hypothetical protein
MAKKAPKKQPAKKESDWPPMHQEVEAIGEPGQPEEAIMHHKPGPGLVDKLSALKGMNRLLAEQIVKDGDWPTGAGDLAHKYGLSQMDAENVLEVLNENRGGKK